MRTVVAAIGGLILGHILWLIAISLALASGSVNTWVLAISAVCVVAAVALVFLGRRAYRRGNHTGAGLLLCLPIAPVLLTICVLGVTYI